MILLLICLQYYIWNTLRVHVSFVFEKCDQCPRSTAGLLRHPSPPNFGGISELSALIIIKLWLRWLINIAKPKRKNQTKNKCKICWCGQWKNVNDEMMTKEKTANGNMIKRTLQAGRSMSLRVRLFFFLHGNRKESSFYSFHLLFSSFIINFLFFNGSIRPDGFNMITR